MIVYIASPYTKGGLEANVRRQIETADQLRKLGHLPYAPLLDHYWHVACPHPYEYWMQMSLEWLRKADAVVRLPGESAGADAEVAEALRLGIPVYLGIEAFVDGEPLRNLVFDGIRDVTGMVDFELPDDESLPITQCLCGAKFAAWDFIIGAYEDGARACPRCSRSLYFVPSVRVKWIRRP